MDCAKHPNKQPCKLWANIFCTKPFFCTKHFFGGETYNLMKFIWRKFIWQILFGETSLSETSFGVDWLRQSFPRLRQVLHWLRQWISIILGKGECDSDKVTLGYYYKEIQMQIKMIFASINIVILHWRWEC